MIGQAVANCDLVVKARVGGQARGYVYTGGFFRSDRASEPLLSANALRAMAGAGSELTYTGVPRACGTRMGVDRDDDTYYDRTEIDAGSDPADPLSTPETVDVGPRDGVNLPQLLASFPNPATAAGATVVFDMPAREPVRLRLYDVSGRLVRTLLDAPAGPGRVQAPWDGADDHGARVASGRYYYRLETPTSLQSRSLLLVR
jgi:hypothetical protein